LFAELERKVQKRREKKQRKKEERRHKREKKRRKRHISKHGAPLVRALRDLQPSMAGETVIAVGRIVDEGEPVPALPAKTEHHKRPPAADQDEGLDELSAEAIARRKMKKALERAISSGGGEREEAESVRRWEEEERRRRQAECWRTLPALNRNQDRFRLAKDGRDVILEFDRAQEDTFLPDNTDLWVWGTLEVPRPPRPHTHTLTCNDVVNKARIVPLSELCVWRDVAGTIPLAEEVPVFVVHLAKWKLASECTDSSE
jgi:hypothetical protein